MLKPILNWWRDNSVFITVSITVLILVTSLINPKSINVTSIHISDKILHLVSYAVLMNAWLMAFVKWKKVENQWTLFVILTLFGIIIEVMQGEFTNTRTPDVRDVLANTIGLWMGLVVFKTVFYRRVE